VLPTVAAPETREDTRVIRLAEGQAARRLLIAEDQPDNRLLLHTLLERMGFEVREAVNGEQAVDLAREWHPDLIFMDMRMPVMDGMEATRRIKANAAGPVTKVVALTAHALEQDRIEMLAAGCDGFIRKPYRETEIWDTLTEHLGVRFQYGNQAMGTGVETPGLDSSEVKGLPRATLLELRDALELLDAAHCLDIVVRITVSDAPLGQRLRSMVERLQYRGLLDAVDDALTETTL
jgi:CheY-like chemotaxis protein